MSRFNAEIRLKTEAEDKESGQVVDPYEERKENGPLQRPSQMAATEVEAIMHVPRLSGSPGTSRYVMYVFFDISSWDLNANNITTR